MGAAVFSLSLICTIYTYAIYPLILWIYSTISKRRILKSNFEPHISIVISVWNEESNISNRLDNLLAQDYLTEKTEIIVVSDGSTDETNSIVTKYQNENNIILVQNNERRGKAAALNQGIALANSDIIIFADARQTFERDAISQLVDNFADPQIGCVSGELKFIKDDTSKIQTEMGAYWKYEKWIRKLESQTGSVIGATGAIYAIRKILYIPLPPNTILDDVLTPLNIVMQGYRCVFESKAIAFDSFSKSASQEWRRKVRTLAGNWQLISLRPDLLIPWINPCLWRLVSHKIMRLIVPFALIVLYISGALLPGAFYCTATIIQSLLYILALTAMFFPIARNNRVINTAYFFLILNAAAVTGFWKWISGDYLTAWSHSYDGKNDR